MKNDVSLNHLKNGLAVLAAPMPHLETFTLGLWVRAGARHEDKKQNGLSHLLEHMAFKGTKKRTARQIAEDIENAGGYVNAATGYETTAYWVRLLAHDLPLAVELIADIIQNPAFEARELDREQSVILEEIAQTNDSPEERVGDLLMNAAFPHQPLGRSILGTPNTIPALGQTTLRSYMKTHYRPASMTLAAAGKVDPSQLLSLASRHFGELPEGAAPAPCSAHFRPEEKREEKELEQSHFALAFKGPQDNHPDLFAALVFSHILGGGMASRLFQELREKKGLCYAVSSLVWTFADTGLIGFQAAARPDNLSDLVPAAAQTMIQAAEQPSDQEINRAKSQLKTSLLMTRESSSARAAQIVDQLFTFNRVLSAEESVQKIDAVQKQDVKRVGQAILASKPAIAALGPLRQLEDHDKITARFG